MKTTLPILALIFIISFAKPASANPGVFPLISEVYFDDNDNWTIELCNKFFDKLENLDGLRIVTAYDSSTIKRGVKFKKNCILLTNADLDKPIKLLRNGDCIHFDFKEDSVWYAGYINTFIWGNLDIDKVFGFYSDLVLHYPTSAPRKGQSISAALLACKSLFAAQVSQEIVYSKPTLGYDFFNATATSEISGKVTDKNGNPVKNVWISIGYIQDVDFYLPILTDSLGIFSFKNLYAKEYILSVNVANPDKPEKKQKYSYNIFKKIYEENILLQPDSAKFLNIKLSDETGMQTQFKKDIGFSVNRISDTLFEFSYYNDVSNYSSTSMIFISDAFGKVICYDHIFTANDSVKTKHTFKWSIYDRTRIEMKEQFECKSIYRGKTPLEEPEIYCAIAEESRTSKLEKRRGGYQIANIQKISLK